ncbi:MAG: uridine monophosphate kinase [Acidobacteria bacterium]|nr:MAG: uridine monophosphate kinase [Acidobacteriota bacterium]
MAGRDSDADPEDAGRRFSRILLKVSGEALGGSSGRGLDPVTLDRLAAELAAARADGVELGVVLGGGNFLRGAALAAGGPVGRVTADRMGMLATVMNALALRDVLAARGLDAVVLAPDTFGGAALRFTREIALAALGEGRILLLAGGTGHPFFTTDTAAALRAAEIDAGLLAKATKVDGVYDRDPAVDRDARRFDRLSCREVIERRLAVMDLTAISLCREARIPVVVFDLGISGALTAIARGEEIGTLVTPDD